MYKFTRFLIILFIFSLFFSCDQKNKKAGKIFIGVEKLVEQNPDSALELLKTIESPEDLNSKNYANYQLLYTQAKDKSGISIAEDTLIQSSIAYFLQKKDIPKIALSYFYSGRVNYQQGNHENAIQELLQSKDYAEKSNNENLLGLIHYDLGLLYDEEFNFDLALYNYQQSHDYFFKAGNEKNAIYILRFIGNVYLRQEPQQTKLAFDNYNQVLQYAEEHNDTSQFASTFRNIGIVYREIGDYGKAKEFLLQSIDIDKQKKYAIDNYPALSRLYLLMNQPDSAIYYAEQLSPKVVGTDDYFSLYNYYDTMEKIYTYMLKYKQALEYNQKSAEYASLIYNNKMKQSILSVQEKYASEKLKTSLQKVKLRIQFWFIIALSGLLAAILLTGFLIIMVRKKREKIRQVEQNLDTMREMLEDYKKDKYSLKQALLEQLDIAKKIAQIQAIPSNTADYNSNEVYFKIFGKNMAEKLDWEHLYPVIDKIYDGFVEKLRKKCPDLLEKDIQLCCLLRADFKIDEITIIQGYDNIASSQAQKSRIRKKLGFTGMKELLSFLKNM